MPPFDHEINCVYQHCREEGYDYPTPAAVYRARFVLDAMQDVYDTYEHDVYPTDGRDVIVDCGAGKARFIFHCFPNGAVIATGVINGGIEARHILNSDDIVSFINELDVNRESVSSV